MEPESLAAVPVDGEGWDVGTEAVADAASAADATDCCGVPTAGKNDGQAARSGAVADTSLTFMFSLISVMTFTARGMTVASRLALKSRWPTKQALMTLITIALLTVARRANMVESKIVLSQSIHKKRKATRASCGIQR